ncbi:FadR/GntR family transcriptional regulator [Desulfomonile tiedjei]|uniref:Transcriptional regulator n=1 Tax=Desulfomonile tiedjei (strain ATCC 49306 / DSM 6799 / DCB-1) TaxID=706587 RepID=I4C5T3_DESTA|nr:FadR/GntR family transcriptional regulator [Desulfomonile tiedjei]AFM24924.1 transcriptional regulator [Desulfomonile tiedjei DSM 6799]
MNAKRKAPAEPVFEPIRLERISHKVASQLKKAIGAGVFRVGDRLPSERELAEQMGVSRPSVREAIQQLEIQGFVDIVHGGGSLVKNIAEQEIQQPMELVLGDDKQRVLELAEIRAYMESLAARKAAENRTEEELKRIRYYLKEMQRDFEKGQIRYEVDFKFHTEITAASHNMIFLHLMSSIYRLMNFSIKVHREQMFLSKDSQKKILDHHMAIFKGIQKKDPEAAEAAMKEHLLFVIEEFRRWSASQ